MSQNLAKAPEILFFEDYEESFEAEGGTYEVSEEEILEFGRRFDPQPFHNDRDEATSSPFGGLIAPGCLTFAIRSALYNQLPVRPALVAGLGVDRMDLTNPVRVGDRLSIRISVQKTRRSASRKNQGIVTMRQTVQNQNDEPVLDMVSNMIVRARERDDD